MGDALPAAAGECATKLEAMKIVTRCTSREQFVAMFRKFVNPTSCFIPSLNMRPIGVAMAFSIRLADGTPLLRGHGVVLDAWRTADNPFKRPGVHLGIHRLTNDSTELFEDLLVPRSTATRMPLAAQLRMVHDTQPHPQASIETATPTIEMPPLQQLDAPQLPGSTFVLPANPLTEMTDDLLGSFIESALDEQELEAIPQEALADHTPPDPIVAAGSRDPIATLLGMAPLSPPRVYAAPTPVKTELIDRVERVPAPVVREPWWSGVVAMLRRARRWWVVASVAVVVVVFGVIAIAWASSSDAVAEPLVPPPQPRPSPVTSAAPVEQPAAPAAEPTCSLTVSTTPARAIVRIDDKPVGASPVTVDGSCKGRTVHVSHPRYRTKQVTVTAEPKLHVKLSKR